MKRLNTLLALCLVALLALSGIAVAQGHGRDDRPGDHHGRHHLRDDHGNHGRHHHHGRDRFLPGSGTISTFDTTTGKLKIALTDGESVTGLVTKSTEIKCEGIDQRRDQGNNSGPGGGDDPAGTEPGDDNGGQSEPGDDNGGENPAGAPACSTASLVPGATVGEAELRLEGGMAVFEEIEIGNHS